MEASKTRPRVADKRPKLLDEKCDRTEEGIRFSGTGVTDTCHLHCG